MRPPCQEDCFGTLILVMFSVTRQSKKRSIADSSNVGVTFLKQNLMVSAAREYTSDLSPPRSICLMRISRWGFDATRKQNSTG